MPKALASPSKGSHAKIFAGPGHTRRGGCWCSLHSAQNSTAQHTAKGKRHFKRGAKSVSSHSCTTQRKGQGGEVAVGRGGDRRVTGVFEDCKQQRGG